MGDLQPAVCEETKTKVSLRIYMGHVKQKIPLILRKMYRFIHIILQMQEVSSGHLLSIETIHSNQ